mmetsp:Transcript_52874/g.87871  ORF Transcript_52874/g.87871 Transcript_52874/m.87871 type:complete len:83 (-) Transcript_52874:167-415(-)
MYPKVRELYKAFLHAGKDYPGGLDFVRRRAKAAFLKNSQATAESKLQEALDKGWYVVGEIHALNKLHKYRSLRKSYYQPSES